MAAPTLDRVTYLDHAAATPLRPVARKAWLAAAEQTGNPSSLHGAGRAARRVVEEGRERVAGALGVPPSSIVFTSGGTEADNLGVAGGYHARRRADPGRGVVIRSAIEHKAVVETVEALAAQGAEPAVMGVDAAGVVDPGELKALLAARADDVGVVAVMAVNNEVGSVQPVAELADVCAEFGVGLHCDAVQAVGSVPTDLSSVATTAISGHKLGGPPGVGALIVRADEPLVPLLHGGGHEAGLRAGTLDVPGIAGMAAAIEEAVTSQPAHAARLAALSDRLVAGIRADVPGAIVNSRPGGHPGIVNVTFPGCEGDALMLLLDAAGISVSTGSACTVGIPQPSHVLLAMGSSQLDARAALRFSFGWTSTDQDVTDCLAALPGVVQRARRAGPLERRPS